VTVANLLGTATLLPDPLYSLDLTKKMLLVIGTTSNDVIMINPGATAGSVTVVMNGRSLGTFSPTTRICVHGMGGNDTIIVSQSVTLPAWLFGDNGKDQLMGGGGPTILVGGSGNCTLWGGSGRTIMIAGAGADSLMAGTGDTILVGGTTAYDANARALQAVLNTWTSSASYAARVSTLMSDPTYPLSASTVFNTSAVDSLFGGSGMDFFFQSPGDHLQNTRPEEMVIAVSQTKAIWP
jgi:Ca2+-binding RTX toxin-like protein